MLYKIIVNCISSRLKGIMPWIISKCQSAFVPNRLIFYSTIIAFETLHTIKWSIKGRKGRQLSNWICVRRMIGLSGISWNLCC